MQHHKIIFTFLFTALFGLVGIAQSTLKGQVFNQENVPLESVYVYNKTAESHSHTSQNGFFFIRKNYS